MWRSGSGRAWMGAAIVSSPVVAFIACTRTTTQELLPSESATFQPCVTDVDCRAGYICIQAVCVQISSVVDAATLVGCPVPCASDQTCIGTTCVATNVPDAGLPSSASTSNPCLECPTDTSCEPDIGVCLPGQILPPSTPGTRGASEVVTE